MVKTTDFEGVYAGKAGTPHHPGHARASGIVDSRSQASLRVVSGPELRCPLQNRHFRPKSAPNDVGCPQSGTCTLLWAPNHPTRVGWVWVSRAPTFTARGRLGILLQRPPSRLGGSYYFGPKRISDSMILS